MSAAGTRRTSHHMIIPGNPQDARFRCLGPTDDIYLTFDDGPVAEITATLLDQLARLKIPATFFLNGESIHPGARELVERMRKEGHSIANHGYNHRRDTLDPEFAKMDSWLLESCKIQTRLIRPPFGEKRLAQQYLSANPAATPYNWKVQFNEWDGPIDWDRASNDLIAMPCGSIILLHDGALGNPKNTDRSQVFEATELVVRVCKTRGLTLSGLPM